MPELRRLRYAVAVADELNFTRAAERLGVSQQVLSEQIRRLEDELGLQVFDRTTRQVRVTSHGRQILDEARAVVGAADALRDRARRLASAQAGVVRLGYSRSTAFDTAPLVSAVTEARPELRVEVREVPSRQLPQAARDGDVDVALSRWADDTDQLFAHTLRRLRSGVILRAGDALAGRAEVALGDLAGRSLVMHRREDAPARHDDTLAACAEAGVEPEIVTARLPFDPLFTDVAEGRGVQIASESIRGALPAGLTWVPLASGVLEQRVDLLWDPARAHPARDAFLDEARAWAGAQR
ncbi:MAG TPA: LysR family transcriptional regulator [Solirubrobacteraceae bacterium]|nr:LysR family transcriptional regulator [Solirubrobacteraceae bacterium]